MNKAELISRIADVVSHGLAGRECRVWAGLLTTDENGTLSRVMDRAIKEFS